ncbi:MAG: hypothetical protein KME13_23395 [Myxacorys californica WJT36-NPBG1]|jgi:hypothetical protein|nr:hypothetical protein [Myxacorys californica WJT36-NPBG1]
MSNNQTHYDFDADYVVEDEHREKNQKRRRLLLKVLEFSVYAIVGVLAFYSATPWIAVGNAIGNEIALSSFYKALTLIPILGLVFSFLKWFLLNALGVALWFIVNLIQVTPMLLAIPPVYAGIIDWIKSQREPDSSNPKENEFQRKLSEWLITAFDNLPKFAAIAYLLELVVNLFHYMPYQGEWAAIVKDFPLLEVGKILWIQFGLMVGSILAIEILFKFVLTVHRIFAAIRR